MAKEYVIAEKEQITNIANKIREKEGNNNKMNLNDMANKITNLSGIEEKIAHANIPDYVKEEALNVAKRVQSVRQDDSIVFLALSDSHYYGEQGSAGVDTYVDANGTQGNISNLHGAMGAKVLAYTLDLDFIAHLGDITWGNSTTPSDLLHSQINEMYSFLEESYKGLPVFCCVGNHDSGIYYHNAQNTAGNTGVFTESAEWIYNNFTKFSESNNTVIAGEDCGGYCYRDFPDKKLRVFMLNTSQGLIENSTDTCTYGSQRIWFSNALLELNEKNDASEWSWILLSHYPADYGGTMPLSELLKAYVEGYHIDITNEKTDETIRFDFNGKNQSKMIAQFHGHIHNFKVSKLNAYSTEAFPYDAWRICIPNGQYNRENYYSTVGNLTDIDFKEDKTYLKTPNTGKDTSFVVNVINPSEQVIHSICYGAGYDRVIGYGATVYYSITTNLTNVSIDNNLNSIEEKTTYTATLTPKENYSIDSVIVTMDGIDITNTVYSNNQIAIQEVTGNIKITAVASKPITYTNLVPLSTDESGNIYNEVGYEEKKILSSAGIAQTTSFLFTLTGFMPVNKGDIIRIGGSAAGRDHTEYGWRVAFYDSNYSNLTVVNGEQFGTRGTYNAEDSGVHAFAPNQYACTSAAAYMKISCRTNDTGAATPNGAGLIVTVNQVID